MAGNRRQVSVGGGMQPRWRRDGSELFYLAPDGQRFVINGPPADPGRR